jgi:hypothetical protein
MQDELKPGRPSGNTISAEHMMAIRAFNERENERRAERERWEEKQKQWEHEKQMRYQKEREQKERERKQKLLEQRLEECLTAFLNGEGSHCPRCKKHLQYIHCQNTRGRSVHGPVCGYGIPFGPLMDRIYTMLKEKNIIVPEAATATVENKSSDSGMSSNTSNTSNNEDIKK